MAGMTHAAYLRDQLLNINVVAFEEGSFVNDISEYVATMNYEEGLEYLMAVSGESTASKFIPVLKALQLRKNNDSKNSNVKEQSRVFWGPTSTSESEVNSNNNKKKKKSRGKSILSTSGNNHKQNNSNVNKTIKAVSGVKSKSSSTAARAKGDYSSHFSRGGRNNSSNKDNNFKNVGSNDNEQQKPRGSNYTNCALCGTIIWYNLPEDRICNSKLHPECNNRPIDSVDPRTGLIDYDYGRKRLSNKNKKNKERTLEDDPTTNKFLLGYTTAFERKERLVHFDRKVAARSRVFDDQNDYFQDSNDKWLSQAERDLARRKAEAIREKKTMQRRNVKISFDIAGRRVMSYDENDDTNNPNQTAAMMVLSPGDDEKRLSGGTNNIGTEKNVLVKNDGTGLHQNVLDGRAGKIYERIQTSLFYEQKKTSVVSMSDSKNRKKALNLPTKSVAIFKSGEGLDG
jgi:hypothetical protein